MNPKNSIHCITELNLKPFKDFESCTWKYCEAYSAYMFYLLQCPFRFTTDSKGNLIMISNRFQKVLCLIYQIYAMISMSLWLNYNHIGEIGVQKDPTQIYALATVIASYAGYFAQLKFSWFGREDFKKLCGVSRKLYTSGKPLHWKDRFLILFWFGSTILFMLAMYSLDILRFCEERGCSEIYRTKYFELYWIFGDYLYFETPIWRHLASIVAILVNYWVGIFDLLNVAFICFFPAILVHKLSHEVKGYLRTMGGTLTFHQLNSLYEEVRAYLDILNKCFGAIMFSYCLCTMAYLSRFFPSMMNPQNSMSVIMWFFVVTGIMNWTVIAESSYKFRCISEHIFNNRYERERGYKDLQSLILFTNLGENPLGLRTATFLVSYGFIIKIFGTLLTYIVVILQFTLSQKSCNATIEY